MAAYPSYTIVGALKDDAANFPVSAGGIPAATTAISADVSDAIKAALSKWFTGITITQA